MSAAPLLAVDAFAPGSIGNIGPGLDVLGCAVTGAGDRVIARRIAGEAIVLDDAGHPNLPTDPARHACAIAADAVRRACGVPHFGVALRVIKGLPLSAGQGGSAASAVAAAVAVHALLGEPLDQMTLLACSLEAESVVAGRHLDNLAPSLMGGVVTVLGTDPCDAVRVPVRHAPWFALAYPHITVRTADARTVLPQFVPRATAIAQLASVSAMVTAFASGDLALLGRSLVDHIAEPARAPRVPGFADALRAAREAGEVGGSFSGSGPTTFAVCATEAIAAHAAAAMQTVYRATGVACDTRVVTIDEAGARWRAVDPEIIDHDATGVPA
jgi:homoserine kinase